MQGNLAGLIAIGLRLSAAVIASGISVVALSEPVRALENWQFDASSTQLVISLPKGVTPHYYLMAEPARIVLDLPHTDVGAVATEQAYSGAVRQIRVAQFQPGLARIVMELSPEAVLAPGQVELKQIQGSDSAAIQRWTLRPLIVGAASPASSPATSSPAASSPIAQSTAAPPESAASPLPPLEPGAIEIPVEASAQPAAQPNSANTVSSVAPADSPLPMQVDFSTPLPATSAELATGDGSAASLSLPSVSQAARSGGSAPRPISASSVMAGARSFPIPTADGISVPALSTVTADTTAASTTAADTTAASTTAPTASAPAAIPAQSAAQSAARSAAQPAAAPTSVAFGQPIPGTAQRPVRPVQAVATPRPIPRQTVPGVIQVIPFGQPLPQ